MQKRSGSVLRAAAAATTILSASMSMAAIYYAPVTTLVGDITTDPITGIQTGSATALSSAAAETTINVYADGVANQVAPVAAGSYAQSTSGLQNAGSSATEAQLANNPLVADEAATDTAYTGTSAYVYSGGYAAAANNSNVVNATTANPRVVGYMTVTSNSVGGATIPASATATSTYAGGNIRGAVGTDNASTLYVAGSNAGYRYVPTGSGVTSVSLTANTPGNVRQVEIRNSASPQLYGSSDTGTYVGIQAVGVGTPTTTGNTAAVVLNTSSNSSLASPESFVFLDDTSHSTPASDGGVGTFAAVPYNVVYIADAETGTVANLAGPGIEKWVYTSGTNAANGGWSLAYTIADTSIVSGFATPMIAVAGQEDGNGNVVLYGTTEAFKGSAGVTSTASPAVTTNDLLEFTDPLSATTAPTSEGEVVLAVSPTNTNFRGVALAPSPAPEPATLSLLGMGAIGLMKRRRK